jgi:hypothetical protein
MLYISPTCREMHGLAIPAQVIDMGTNGYGYGYSPGCYGSHLIWYTSGSHDFTVTFSPPSYTLSTTVNPLLSLIAYELISAYALPFIVASYRYGILLTLFLHTPFLCLHQLFLPFASMSTLRYVLTDHSMVPCLLFISGTFCGLLWRSTAFLVVLRCLLT